MRSINNSLVLLAVFFVASISRAPAQNIAIPWSVVSNGFGVSAEPGTTLRSNVGASFGGDAGAGNDFVASGFFRNWIATGIAMPYAGPVYTFSRTFGTASTDRAYSMELTADSGYILAGETYQAQRGIYLAKADRQGTMLWAKQIFSNDGGQTALAVCPTPDSGFIIGGYRNAGNSIITNPLVVRTNAYGDTLWTKLQGISGSSQANSSFNSVGRVSGGGFVTVGHYNPGVIGNIYFVRWTDSGSVVWTRQYYSNDAYGTAVQQTNDGGFIIGGYSIASGIRYVDLVKTNDTGGVKWIKYMGPNGYSTLAYDVQQTGDGGYIVTGSSGGSGNANGGAFLWRLNGNGDSLWLRKYHDADEWAGFSVRQTDDGGFIMTGSKYNTVSQKSDVFLLKIDANGDSLWTVIYGGLGDDVGRSVRPIYDGGFAIGGYSNSSGSGEYDALLIKGDNVGFVTSVSESRPSRPVHVRLHQNYPNPFNPATVITYVLPNRTHVAIVVYNILGQKIATLVDEVKEIGSHAVEWNAAGYSSGLYFYRLDATSVIDPTKTFSQTKKMLLIK